jgi:hypothetical protein
MLSVTFFYCHAEYPRADCRYADSHYTDCRYADSHYTDCHFFHYTDSDSHYTDCHLRANNINFVQLLITTCSKLPCISISVNSKLE